MVLVDGEGTPLGVSVEAASPAEVNLLEPMLDTVRVKKGRRPGRPRKNPDRLILDKAYDSNPLRKRLARKGIEPIIPARSTHKKATHQDGRKLKRYKNRWKVERTNAWIQNFRRIYVRYDRSEIIYSGFVHLACAMVTLKKLERATREF